MGKQTVWPALWWNHHPGAEECLIGKEEERRAGRRGRAGRGSLVEVIRELDLRTGVRAQREGVLIEDAKRAKARRRGCMSHLYVT